VHPAYLQRRIQTSVADLSRVGGELYSKEQHYTNQPNGLRDHYCMPDRQSQQRRVQHNPCPDNQFVGIKLCRRDAFRAALLTEFDSF